MALVIKADDIDDYFTCINYKSILSPCWYYYKQYKFYSQD